MPPEPPLVAIGDKVALPPRMAAGCSCRAEWTGAVSSRFDHQRRQQYPLIAVYRGDFVPTPLYRPHPRGIAATYAEVENHALAQDDPLVGTPGAITLRRHGSGGDFYVRQYYDHDRVKRDQYIVAGGASDADERVRKWHTRIREANDLVASVRLLSREGYLLLTPRQLAAIAPLAIHGIFAAGGVLVGSNAYTVIVNRLGIRSDA